MTEMNIVNIEEEIMEIDIEAMRRKGNQLPEGDRAMLFKNLMNAVLFRATKDYAEGVNKRERDSLPSYYFDKRIIIGDLMKPEMVSYTDGMSLTVVNALRTDVKNIRKNLKKIRDDERKLYYASKKSTNV